MSGGRQGQACRQRWCGAVAVRLAGWGVLTDGHLGVGEREAQEAQGGKVVGEDGPGHRGEVVRAEVHPGGIDDEVPAGRWAQVRGGE